MPSYLSKRISDRAQNKNENQFDSFHKSLSELKCIEHQQAISQHESHHMKYLYDECVAICIIYWASIQIDSFISVDSAEMFVSWPQSRTDRTEHNSNATIRWWQKNMWRELKICIKMCISFGHFNLCSAYVGCMRVFIFGAIMDERKSGAPANTRSFVCLLKFEQRMNSRNESA